MGTLCDQGLLVPLDPELKKELTVRANLNALGFAPPSFKLFRIVQGQLLVPRYYGLTKFGPATKDSRQSPARAHVGFTGTLRTETCQDRAFEAGIKAFETVGGGVLSLPCGFGKCLGKDTLVMMFDGTIKKVQDIQVGELIMGDDSTPRTILSTCTGTEQLYKIVPTKGDPYIVNESHILSLKYVQTRNKKCGEILDISVLDYINKSDDFKHNEVRGYRVPVLFPHQSVPLDPYMLGYWLGDGCSTSPVISSQDSTVFHYFRKNLSKYNLYLDYISKYDYRIRGSQPNYFYRTLKELNLLGNKHIPHMYKCNSREVQLQVLAGLIDSDGSAVPGGWEFIQKNEKLFDDVLFLCRSLGFACYKQKCTKTCTNSVHGPKQGIYFRCSISGSGVEDVPCKIPRKKCSPRKQIKNVLHVGINVEKLGIGEYYGFEIDGNHRFVLGDFTVTHNTTVSLALASHLKLRTIIIVHKEFLLEQWVEKIKEFCPGATIGKIQQDVFNVEKDFVLAMIQTMCTRELPSLNTFGLVIVDEAHHIGAAAFSQAMFKLCPKYTLGLTATPERKDGLTRILYWFLGPQFFMVERENQHKTKVKVEMFSDPLYKSAPPMNKFGKVNMAEMVTQISELKSRNELILKLIQKNLKKDRKIIVLCDRREQCFYLKNQFPNTIGGVYLGQMSESDLAETAKKPLVIATFAMAAEGLDIAQLDTCILASPHSDVTQAVGRIMRETKGKKHSPLIYDIVDKWSMFYSMYKKRCTFYKKSGFEFENKLGEEKQKVLQECAFI